MTCHLYYTSFRLSAIGHIETRTHARKHTYTHTHTYMHTYAHVVKCRVSTTAFSVFLFSLFYYAHNCVRLTLRTCLMSLFLYCFYFNACRCVSHPYFNACRCVSHPYFNACRCVSHPLLIGLGWKADPYIYYHLLSRTYTVTHVAQ